MSPEPEVAIGPGQEELSLFLQSSYSPRRKPLPLFLVFTRICWVIAVRLVPWRLEYEISQRRLLQIPKLIIRRILPTQPLRGPSPHLLMLRPYFLWHNGWGPSIMKSVFWPLIHKVRQRLLKFQNLTHLLTLSFPFVDSLSHTRESSWAQDSIPALHA